MLLEVEGERVRVFTGLGMRWLPAPGPGAGRGLGKARFPAPGRRGAHRADHPLNLRKPQVGEGQA
jgi:hypothetical protein